MKLLHLPFGLLLAFSTSMLAGRANQAFAEPIAVTTVAVAGPSLSAADFLSPMACKPINACATVSPASVPAIRPVPLPKIVPVE